MAGHNSFFGYMAGNTNSFNIMHKHIKFKRSSLIKLKSANLFFERIKMPIDFYINIQSYILTI